MEVKDKGEKVIRTECMIQCGVNCPVLCHVKDGVLTKIEPAPFPTYAERYACPQTLLTPQIVNHPDRLKYPMKRMGERGEGKWQRISWDEALDTIASKFKDIGEKYGPESVTYMCGGLVFPSGALFATQRWASATEGTFVGLLGCSTSAATVANALEYGNMWTDYLWDHDNTQMYVLWGENILVTGKQKYQDIRDTRERGGKMVFISPVFTATAAKADQWIPIRPGTDAALAWGLMNVIVSEGIYDGPFLTEHTVGPFLVRNDNGRFLREKHISSGGKTNKYIMWDIRTNKPQLYNTPGIAPALRGSYTVDGIECKTAFQLLVEQAEQYTLERTSEITDIAPDTIKRLAFDYATRKPVATYKGLGTQRYFHGDLTFRAINTLAAVTGNISRRPWLDFFGKLDFAGFMCPGGRMFRSLPIIQFYEAAQTGDPYPVKALWVSNHNPGDSHSNRNKFKKAVAQMEFIVTVELFMTTTAEYSDIVLPGCTSFESTGITLPWGSYLHAKPYFQLNPKVIEPYYECKVDLDIFNELAPRMGVEEFFTKSEEEYVEDLFADAPPPLKGITMEKLKEAPVRHPHDDRLFPSPSGRIEFYAETMKEFGEELPVFKEPPESARQPLAQKYPLTLLNMHSKHRHHSTYTNIDWLREMDPEPTLDINPVDAEKRGILDGDIITVFNDRASVILKARFNEGMRPGYVSVGEGWQAKDFIKGHYNELTADEMNPAQEAVSETVMQMQDILCEVKKAEEV